MPRHLWRDGHIAMQGVQLSQTEVFGIAPTVAGERPKQRQPQMNV